MTEHISHSEAETAAIAASLAAQSRPGQTFALYGDLGVGKSAFARGFIQALCGNIDVPSPTFTLVQTYEISRGTLSHFDLYRLEAADDVLALDWDEAMATHICLIEWPQRAGTYLPGNSLRINITTLGPESRKIEIDDPRS